MSSPEQLPSSAEKGAEVSASAAEQLEALERNANKSPEQSVEQKEKAVESAKIEAKERAISVEAGGAEKGRKEPASAPKRHGVVSRKERDKSFKKQMTHVQSQMSAPSRAFSKFIHNKPVEKASDFIGSTVARPDAILAGAVVAFVLVLGVYLLAKSLGYVLSGFETIGAFIVGWILGTVYDYLKVVITGKR